MIIKIKKGGGVLKREEGSALVLALIVSMVLLSLLAAFSYRFIGVIQASAYEERTMQALYLAEAGIEYARLKLDDSDVWNGDKELKKPNNDCIWSQIDSVTKTIISIENQSHDKIRLTSKAIVGGLTKTIIVIFENEINNAFDNVVHACDEYRTSGTNPVSGALAVEKQDENTYPKIDLGHLKTTADVSYNASSPEVSVNSDGQIKLESLPPLKGDKLTFIDGDLILTKEMTRTITGGSGRGMLVVNGDIEISEDAKFEIEEFFSYAIIAKGDITVSGSLKLKGTVYAKGSENISDSKGHVKLSGTSSVKGNVMSRGLTELSGDNVVSYNDDFLKTFEEYDVQGENIKYKRNISGYSLASWQEK